MVEVNAVKRIIMNKIFRVVSCLAVVLCASAAELAAQEIAPRIAGLETHAEYMSLLREDARLQMREDSVARAMDRVRVRLREHPEERQRLAQDILDCEARIFEIRNTKGRLIDRINTIEQEWVLSNLDAGDAVQAAGGADARRAVPDSLKVRNLIDNVYFREHLPAVDYAALRKAQQLERIAVDYVNRYFSNYGDIAALAERYAAVPTEQEALEVYGRYEELRRSNGALADSLAGVWNYVFDNKSYAYGYLLDGLGEDEVLGRGEEQFSEAARRMADLRGRTASDAVADYFLRKRVLVDYETAVAEVLRLDAARDSLRGVAGQLSAIDFRLPAVRVEERLFLEYDSIAFSATPKYTYQHPIPECRVYPRGTMYRILLGTFNTKRAAATFKGAYPLSYEIDEDGKWRYFAGGFASREEADAAQKQMKARGFLRPEVVVWEDGVYRNLSREPQDGAQAAYRVEIVSEQPLSEEVKEAIVSTADGRELSRVGQQLFVVGVFELKEDAERVAAAAEHVAPGLEIKVAEVAAE